MLEKILETRTCTHCSSEFDITEIDQDFLKRLAPTIGTKTFTLPFPTECPECRKFARLAWRNEKKLYKRRCDLTGEDMISIFPPTARNPIYSVKAWNSDAWDTKKYGKDYDSSRTFFEQFHELISRVPLPGASIGPGVENSDYSGACSWIRDCYLSFSIQSSESVHYSVDVVECKNSIDCLGIMNAENCYECIEVYDSYDLKFAYNVKNSHNCMFLLDCNACHDCYGCFGLENASYHIFNRAYSKDEYEGKLSELKNLTITEQKKNFEDFYKDSYSKKPLPNTGSENVWESENIIESKNVSFSRHIRGAEDVRYSQKFQVPEAHLCMDTTSIGSSASSIYMSYQGFHNSSNLYFSAANFHEVHFLYYSAYCRNGVHHCFGCVGLHQGESYCIFNKQYTKEEWEIIVSQIIEKMIEHGEWGKFFPRNLSPLGYDDTVCQILHPLNEEQAKQQGYNWSGYESPFPKAEKTIPAKLLPESIDEVPDDILNWAIECEVSKKPFRIIRQELEFYRKNNLPIPRKHPDERYKERTKIYMNY